MLPKATDVMTKLDLYKGRFKKKQVLNTLACQSFEDDERRLEIEGDRKLKRLSAS